jgi:RNA 3'-terminal phosphate cyclase (ATP)
MMVEIVSTNVTEVFTGFGEPRISAEEVAARVVDEVREYLVAGVPVGPNLADQLLLPMALAGAGTIVTMTPTQHTRTNIDVIKTFLPVSFNIEQVDRLRWRLSVAS